MRKRERVSADLQNNGVLWSSLHPANPKLSTNLRRTSAPHFFMGQWDQSFFSLKWSSEECHIIQCYRDNLAQWFSHYTIQIPLVYEFISQTAVLYCIVLYTAVFKYSIFNWVSHQFRSVNGHVMAKEFMQHQSIRIPAHNAMHILVEIKHIRQRQHNRKKVQTYTHTHGSHEIQ